MVALCVIIKLATGVVPQSILEKHTLSMKKVVAMKMNAEEFVQAFGLLISIGCALYSLGNYGAGGNFEDDAEKYAAFVVPGVGATCLLLTAVLKMVAIRGELKRGEVSDHLRQGESGSSSSEVVLIEASSFWFYIGVLPEYQLHRLHSSVPFSVDRGGIVRRTCGSYVYISQGETPQGARRRVTFSCTIITPLATLVLQLRLRRPDG